MVPIRVYLKNFLCHDEQEFSFEGHAVWLLHGPNGAGKSAVFDGMVYALFGEHQRHDVAQNSGVDLIRHGQSSFRVEFDFEYDGRRYRVWRTRSRSGTTQGASELVDGGPRPVRDVNKVKELDKWVVDTLGLTYETFVSAVLLRQGAAEKLIDAKKDARREMFRGIIDIDRFIKLHAAIAEARTAVGREARSLEIALERVPVVTDEQLAEAAALRDASVARWETARAAERSAGERVGHSRLWEQWSKSREDVLRALEAAAGRASREAELERAVSRMETLRGVLASLTRVSGLKTELAAAQGALASLQTDRDRVQTLVELDRRIAESTSASERLRAQIRETQLRRLLERRLEDLKGFEADLEEQAARAGQAVDEARAAKDAAPYLEALFRHRAEHGQAVCDEQAAADSEAAAASEVALRAAAEREAGLALRDAEGRKAEAEQAHAVAVHAAADAADRRDRFASLADKAQCSECGQPIDAVHAARERIKLDRAAHAATTALEASRAELDAATAEAGSRRGDFEARQEEHRQAVAMRDHATRARQHAARRRDEVRGPFDRALAGLTPDYAGRVASIDQEGFPDPADLEICGALKAGLSELLQTQEQLRRRLQDRDKAASEVETLRQAVVVDAPPADAEAATAELERLEAELESLRSERERLDEAPVGPPSSRRAAGVDCPLAADELNRLSTEVGRAESTVASVLGRLEEAIGAVPDTHRACLAGGGPDTSPIEDELRDLEATGAEDEFAAMANDRALRADRERQLAELEGWIAALPEDACLPVAAAQAAADAAAAALAAAEGAKAESLEGFTRLSDQRSQRAEIGGRLAAEERSLSLHQRLADLLGDRGIQLDLVRDAERRIVDLANDVLGRVSVGELRIDPPDPAGDRAFDLNVRRAGCPGPIAAANLSGGQRFRLAVSLALAVCRFAGGERRPLESVIIDEGFGSLDRDGRMAMIAELRDGQALRQLFKRVLIVSHQDDLASAFPVGYRLRSDGAITVAEPFGPR